MSGPDSDEPDRPVAQFPPIPRVPDPPRFPPDPRQTRSARIISNIAERIAQTGMDVAGPNLVSGYHASAINLGQLQQTLEHGLSRFDQARLTARWPEVLGWINEVLVTWIQRPKETRVELKEKGIRIELTSQDDLGYYDYAFDVFPNRGKPRSKTVAAQSVQD